MRLIIPRPGRRALRVVARAKLTLSVRVLGTRPDGFHELNALVTSVSQPSDVIVLGARDRRFRVRGPAAGGVPDDDSNLVLRAADALGAHQVSINRYKYIPAGSGLGGGSADAAAVLVGVDRLLQRRSGAETLRSVGAGLGSDIPFCIEGGLAWMRGRGEIIEPLAPRPGPPLVVVVPHFSLATPAVYRAWDELGGPASTRRCPPPPELADLLPDGLVNDLEPAAEVVEPRLRPFRESVESLAGAQAVLAGSGAAYFVPVRSVAEANALAVRLKGEGMNAYPSQPVSGGVECAWWAIRPGGGRREDVG